MFRTISYYLAQARIADLHRQAERDTAARAARRAGPDRRGPARPRWPAWGRRVLAVLGARST
jgi:hypothetical protein